MGNEHEYLNKGYKNKNLGKSLRKSKSVSDDEKDNNKENKKDFEKYDNEISKMLFDDEIKEKEEKKPKEQIKKDKKSELKSYADQIAEEQFMEEINRSKSLNKDTQRNKYILDNNQTKNIAKKENKKEEKNNNIKIEINDIDNINNNNIKQINNKKIDHIENNKKYKIDDKNENKKYEKIEPKPKKRNFLKRMFTPIKKLTKKRFKEEEKTEKTEKTQNISSPAVDINLKKPNSTQIPDPKIFINESKNESNIIKTQIQKETSINESNINKGYISEGNAPQSKHISNTGKKQVLTKDIYDKIKPEDLKVFVLYMKNSNNKYQEGLDLFNNKKYNEAKNSFNQARASFMNLNKLINNNPVAYPNKFRVVISLKINEKMRATLNLIKDCNSFLMQKPEKSSRSHGKTVKILNFNLMNKKSNNIDYNKDLNNNNNYNSNKDIEYKTKLNLNNKDNDKGDGVNIKNDIKNKINIRKENSNKKENISNINKLKNLDFNINKIKNNKEINKNNNNSNNNINKNNINYNGKINNNIKNEIEEKINSKIIIKNLGVGFKDIIGLENLKNVSQEITIIQTKNNFEKGILLYGPSGVGKKTIAKVIATECKNTFFNINSYILTSKWLGESEKIIKILFKLAYNKSPSIIFINEIDLIFNKRNENENDEITKKLKKEFLNYFNILNKKKDIKIIIMASTNRHMNIDEDILKILSKRIYCGPLDENGRFELIKKIINKVENSLNDNDIKEISKLTEGYSNSDLISLCKDAAFQQIRELNMEEILKISKFRPLVKDDLMKSLNKIEGSLNKEVIEELLKWGEI